MRRSRRWIVLLAATVAAICLAVSGNSQQASRAVGQQEPTPSQTLSDRVVEYSIDATYDARSKSLEGKQTLTYHNKTGQPLDRFPFHLYLNAFQPDSTWMQEARRDDPRWQWDPEMYGSIMVSLIEAEGMGDLTSKMQFVASDDRNPRDKTVMEVSLPRAVAPGESVTFKISFKSTFPRAVARTGYKGDFIMGAQWFPKVGVWWKGAWNAHQFHEATEFFSDFGTYDVKLTLPDNFVVGATGVETARQKNSGGTQTISYHADDVIDFAWTADPKFIITEDELSGTKIRLLMLPDHVAQTSRHMDTLKRSMQMMEEWFGPYPYPQITVIDPASEEAAGMEYPMLITAGTVWGMPKNVRLPEVVVAHEYAHQYWYAVVANNEFEEPWLDEGLTTYSEIKLMEKMFGDKGAFSEWLGAQMSARGDYWRSYIGAAERDPISRSAITMLDRKSVGMNAYHKPALTLLTLEGMIGEKTVLRGLKTFYEKYSFKHPTRHDFIETIEQTSGTDVRWFLDQALNGTERMDYAISGESFEIEQPKNEPLYKTEVTVERKGGFVFPVTVEIAFDNGEKIREQWDGKDRWKRFTYERSAKFVSAEIDPDHKVWLDQSRFNNSDLAKPDRRATRKLTAYWIVAVQSLQQVIGWLS
jgi:hypothetical protein